LQKLQKQKMGARPIQNLCALYQWIQWIGNISCKNIFRWEINTSI